MESHILQLPPLPSLPSLCEVCLRENYNGLLNNSDRDKDFELFKDYDLRKNHIEGSLLLSDDEN